jgi:hypothetical protein
MSDDVNGQILSGSAFSEALKNIMSTHRPSSILEIGTWKGLGSTKRIIDNIIELNLNTSFVSVECNEEFYNIAKSNLKNFSNYVSLLYGRVIKISDIIQFLQSNPIEFDDQYRWLLEDVQNAEQCPYIIDQIPDKIDLLLLDGGEFSTYSEWQMLKNRSKVIMLDDVNVMKCRQIKKEVISNPNEYKILYENNERHGSMAVLRLLNDK